MGKVSGSRNDDGTMSWNIKWTGEESEDRPNGTGEGDERDNVSEYDIRGPRRFYPPPLNDRCPSLLPLRCQKLHESGGTTKIRYYDHNRGYREASVPPAKKLKNGRSNTVSPREPK